MCCVTRWKDLQDVLSEMNTTCVKGERERIIVFAYICQRIFGRIKGN